MANFYYGNDEGQPYWLNLDHVSFVKPESDKLILKSIDGAVFKVDQEDYHALKQILWEKTLNGEDEFINEPSVDYGYDNSQSTDDDHLDIEPPTGIPFKPKYREFKPEDWQPKDCDLDDDEIPI